MVNESPQHPQKSQMPVVQISNPQVSSLSQVRSKANLLSLPLISYKAQQEQDLRRQLHSISYRPSGPDPVLSSSMTAPSVPADVLKSAREDLTA